MKCQNLFSGANKKNISVCRLLKILPRVLSVTLCTLVTLLLNVSTKLKLRGLDTSPSQKEQNIFVLEWTHFRRQPKNLTDASPKGVSISLISNQIIYIKCLAFLRRHLHEMLDPIFWKN